MKKLNLLPMLLLVVMGLFIVSCNKDDDDQPTTDANIVGTWTCTAFDYTGTSVTEYLGQSITADFTGEGYDINFTLTFSEDPNEAVSDGYYSIKLTTTLMGQSTTEYLEMQDFTYTGTWVKDGDQLTISEDSESSVATITELTSSSLKISITDVQTISEGGATGTTTTNVIAEFTR